MNQITDPARLDSPAYAPLDVARPQIGSGLAYRLRSRLRGRYHWAVLLAVVLGALGGWVGYASWSPVYRSVGQIKIAPVMPRVIYRTEDNSLLPMYEGFLNSQVQLIQTNRVLDLAMQKQPWKSLGRGVSGEVVQSFTESLNVARSRGSQIIYVSFEDTDPKAAHAGASSVIGAYMEIYGEQEMKQDEMTLKVLEQRRITLNNELKSLRERIHSIANEFGSDSLGAAYAFKLGELHKIEGRLKDIQLQIAEVQTVEQSTEQGATIPELSPFQIANEDRTMQTQLERRQHLELELAALMNYHKANHPAVVSKQRELANTDKAIADYSAEYNEARLRGGVAGLTNPEQDVNVLAAREKRFHELYEQAKAEMLDLGRKDLQINALEREVATVTQRLRETEQRVEQLNVESTVKGRISVVSDGHEPRMAANYRSQKQRIIFGVLGGLSLGIGWIVFIGVLDKRYRYIEDTDEGVGHFRMLGVLPRLPDDLRDEEQAAIAAHSVHQIRTLLQIGAYANRSNVFGITSPMGGDGKTSLALALGLSFAASGSRTLLIDFDLQGRGLTTRMGRGTCRRIGEILLRNRTITPAQLQQGLELAASNRKRIGETLVELGFLSEHDLAEALSQQVNSMIGLPDVLAGEAIENCITETDNPLLSILPVGDAGPHMSGSLSPPLLNALVSSVRQRYNTVLIDTGPAPASLEATLVTPQCEGVILVVSQGAQRPIVERAVEHLMSIDAKIAGFVFNRAAAQDVERYGSTSTLSRRLTESELGPETKRGGKKRPIPTQRFGPVAGATARALPAPRNGDGDGNGNGNGDGNGKGRGRHDGAADGSATRSSSAVADIDAAGTGTGTRDSEVFLERAFRMMLAVNKPDAGAPASRPDQPEAEDSDQTSK